nr:serine/threonine-protein phosphatase 6 regulatory ankyrin repeat subunit C-like isoform X2 [Nerophis lumbriciformis]
MRVKARKIQTNVKPIARASRSTSKRLPTGTTRKVVERRNRFGETLLHEAVLNQDVQLLKDILKLRPNVNMADKTGRTALHEAALRNQYEACLCLLNAGALVNVASQDKVTPLHDATTFGNEKIVELLLKHGSHPPKEEAFGSNEEHTLLVQVATMKARSAKSTNIEQELGAKNAKTKQDRDVGMELHGDVQLEKGEDVQNGKYQTVVPQENHKSKLSNEPLQASNSSCFPENNKFSSSGTTYTRLFQGYSEEESRDSDQTVDFLGDSSDESADWSIKDTQNFN